MNTEIQKALEQIAMEESLVLAERGGLDFRGIDADTTEVSIMTLRMMLARAYELAETASPDLRHVRPCGGFRLSCGSLALR